MIRFLSGRAMRAGRDTDGSGEVDTAHDMNEAGQNTNNKDQSHRAEKDPARAWAPCRV